jgi:hypothetical protein
MLFFSHKYFANILNKLIPPAFIKAGAILEQKEH